jgi:hypothetical protein
MSARASSRSESDFPTKLVARSHFRKIAVMPKVRGRTM